MFEAHFEIGKKKIHKILFELKQQQIKWVTELVCFQERRPSAPSIVGNALPNADLIPIWKPTLQGKAIWFSDSCHANVIENCFLLGVFT